MFETHYPALVGGYCSALGGWWIARRFVRWWPPALAPKFERPLRELLYALLGGIGVIAIGMLWSRGIRLPEDGPFGPLIAALNQLMIFSPIILVPILRRQGLDTLWCGGAKVVYRIGVGLLLGTIAITAYSHWSRFDSRNQ